MSGGYLYPNGLDAALVNWLAAPTFEWALLKASYVPAPNSHVYMSSIVTGNELTDASYARQAVSNEAKTIVLPSSPNGTGGAIRLECDDPAFGVISGGEVAAWLVLYQLVTNDADSPVVAVMPCGYTADGVTPATFILPASGAASIGFACPTGFY